MPEIKPSSIKSFYKSTTGKLALTYLLIIMIMSVGFSVVFYKTSSNQLGRQIPPPSFYENRTQGFGRGTVQIRGSDFDEFFQNRIDEGRKELLIRLIILNLVALIAGGALSYALARRTLRPIEDAMEAQSRFVSDASHELRTPITALRTTNEVALRKQRLSISDAKELIHHNIEEAEKLKNLTDGLLSLLKHDGNNISLSSVPLQDIVGEAMNQVLPQASEKNISIDDQVQKINVLGNKQLLVQLATILLDNAIKYSDEKSVIYMKTAIEGNYALLSIKDEGIGISASDLPHIFDRFYRADRSRSKINREGYGLGLSIAKKIADQHNAEIIVESTLDSGSTFTLKIPTA